jgi:signal peptidase I
MRAGIQAGARANAVNIARCEMAAEVLRSFGEVRLRVTGSSMLPAVLPGDVIDVVRIEPGEVRSGDIVLFERSGRLFAHRVVETGQRIVTRGDRHRKTDGPVEERELLGRVTKLTRGGRVISAEVGLAGRIAGAILRRSDWGARAVMRVAGLARRIA